MVDDSQGHRIYASDALLTQDMNFNPSGSQPKLRDGWFINISGEKITQHMNFPADHPKFPDQPKGMKQILTERGLYWAKLKMQCKKPDCDADATDCCAKRILDLQPDFQEQKSLVHETIEAAGHLCIMLPKYHCELNFIEFFWGAIKEISPWTLRLHLLWSPKKYSWCHGLNWCAYYSEVGALDDTMDGCLLRREGHQRGTDSGEEIWQP